MTINYANAVRRTIRRDPIVQAIVGEDQDSEIKVYSTVAKSNTDPPYVVLTIIPTEPPENVYGDNGDAAIEAFEVVVSSWARNPDEAWQLGDVVDEALKRGDYSFEPGYLMAIRRVSTPQELPDDDAGYRQLIVRYEVILGR